MKKVLLSAMTLCLALGLNVQAANISWAHLQWVASTTPNAGSDFEAMGLVFADGITNAQEKNHDAIIAQIGYGTTADPFVPSSWTWVDAAFNSEWGDNYAFQQKIAAPWCNGTFYYTFRFRFNEQDSEWKYAGDNGLWNATDHPCGTFTVSNGYEITWAHLQWEASTTPNAGANFEAMGLVYCNEISTTDPQRTDMMLAQIGYGTTVDPHDGNWTWQDAGYNSASGSNMAYQQKIIAPMYNGTYYYSFRFKLNTFGADWVYAGNNGLWNATDHPCKTFTISNGYEITWAKLDWIANEEVATNGEVEISALVFCNGISTEEVPDATKIVAEIGYGSVNNPLDAAWVWATASYNRQSGSNMLYQQKITAPELAGTYYYSYRFRLAKDGMPWIYAGNNGKWDGTTSVCKTFTVKQMSYIRDVTIGDYGTICLPLAAASFSGAEMYIISGKMEGDAGIYIDQVDVMEAGVPYIFKATADKVVVEYAEGEPHSASSVNGLVGYIGDEDLTIPKDAANYLIYSNALYYVNTEAKIASNRAYIDFSQISSSPSTAPKLKRAAMPINGAPTSLININESTRAIKSMHNGQIVILRDGKMYNVLGQNK